MADMKGITLERRVVTRTGPNRMHLVRWIGVLSAATLLSVVLEPAGKAQPAAMEGQSTNQWVTREEYDKLKQEFEDLKKRLEATSLQQPTNMARTLQSLDEANTRISNLEIDTRLYRPGFNRVIIAGDATAGFMKQEGADSTFSADLAPLFLWHLNDRLLWEGAFDVGLETDSAGNSDTTFDLGLADVSYILNDYVTLGAGLFTLPFSVYHNHYDPPWIHPLPDDPLPFGDGGIAPSSGLGAFAQGAIPIGHGSFNYHLYVQNGPRLVTDDPSAAGTLDFDNYVDNNNFKTFGGRVAFRPVPELEFGYSTQYGEVGTGRFDDVYAWLQAGDIEYRRDVGWLYGIIDLRAEYVYSHVSRAVYGPGALPPFGPYDFNNNRQGGYVLAAYRPWMLEVPVVPNLQAVFRYDWLYTPLNSPGGDHERRWTVGLNYWLRPNAVLKFAYEFDHKEVGQRANAVLVQVGVGL